MNTGSPRKRGSCDPLILNCGNSILRFANGAGSRVASRPVPGLTFSLQSCVSAVETVFMDEYYLFQSKGKPNIIECLYKFAVVIRYVEASTVLPA